MLNNQRKQYSLYTYQSIKNDYNEDIKTPVFYKTIQASIVYTGNYPYIVADLKLKETQYVAITNDTDIAEGMKLDKYEVVFVLPHGIENYCYLKVIE
ncbi:MAG: hypothetical protein VB064_03150 [Oscillospiraceae bacterium]|nr:hypothetical protein [Oscillospiraceae bacterium]